MAISNVPVLMREELIVAAISGDRAATLTLLEHAQPEIRRIARRQCNSSADADDAAQETLLLLYQHVATLRVPLALVGWLNTIIRRACLRLARVFDIPLPEHVLAETILAEKSVSELRLDLANAINSLPRQYREIVLLRDIQEFTIEEIVSVLGLSREAVKGRLHRARRLMREYLID